MPSTAQLLSYDTPAAGMDGISDNNSNIRSGYQLMQQRSLQMKRRGVDSLTTDTPRDAPRCREADQSPQPHSPLKAEPCGGNTISNTGPASFERKSPPCWSKRQRSGGHRYVYGTVRRPDDTAHRQQRRRPRAGARGGPGGGPPARRRRYPEPSRHLRVRPPLDRRQASHRPVRGQRAGPLRVPPGVIAAP